MAILIFNLIYSSALSAVSVVNVLVFNSDIRNEPQERQSGRGS